MQEHKVEGGQLPTSENMDCNAFTKMTLDDHVSQQPVLVNAEMGKLIHKVGMITLNPAVSQPHLGCNADDEMPIREVEMKLLKPTSSQRRAGLGSNDNRKKSSNLAVRRDLAIRKLHSIRKNNIKLKRWIESYKKNIDSLTRAAEQKGKNVADFCEANNKFTQELESYIKRANDTIDEVLVGECHQTL